MRNTSVIVATLLGLGCGGGQATDASDDGGGGGRCGAVTQHSLDLAVEVVDGDGTPVEGASVRLDERVWEPGTLGTGTTDGAGTVTLAGLSLTSVEDCWGTALGYFLVVEKDALSTETPMNSTLFNAVSSGDASADRRVTLQ